MPPPSKCCCHHATVTLIFGLLIPKFNAFISVAYCIVGVSLVQIFRIYFKICVTFRYGRTDGRTDARTNKQTVQAYKNVMLPDTLRRYVERRHDDTCVDDTVLQCSLTECDDDTWNIKQARLFKSKWGTVGQTFSCFYNPERQEVVILERTSPFAAVNAVVWPCLLLLAGVSLWIGLCLGCWSLGNDIPYNREEYLGASIRLQ